MLKIAIGDWFLARSEGFKLIVGKLRDHKINTKKSFSNVKRRHNIYERKFEEQDKRIKDIEKLLQEVYEVPLVKKKKK